MAGPSAQRRSLQHGHVRSPPPSRLKTALFKHPALSSTMLLVSSPISILFSHLQSTTGSLVLPSVFQSPCYQLLDCQFPISIRFPLQGHRQEGYDRQAHGAAGSSQGTGVQPCHGPIAGGRWGHHGRRGTPLLLLEPGEQALEKGSSR